MRRNNGGFRRVLSYWLDVNTSVGVVRAVFFQFLKARIIDAMKKNTTKVRRTGALSVGDCAVFVYWRRLPVENGLLIVAMLR